MADDLLEKLQDVEERYRQVEQALSDPAVYQNPAEAERLGRLRAELLPIVEATIAYRKLLDDLLSAQELLDSEHDPELVALAQEEIDQLQEQQRQLEDRLKRLLLPKDPNDAKNTVVEIRAGTGGEEAALFAADLFRMYSRYAERRGWKVEVVEANPTELGGFKEIVFTVSGDQVYSRLKFESGVHRVQRVPETEASGRIHTSAVTVAVLPEAEEIDVQIDPEDLRIDTFRAGGPGGQHVNMTDSAVRITHLPTGIVVTCSDERSQLKNRQKAMRVLRARLYDLKQREQEKERSDARRSMIGSGDRSEKIRTYNFPDGRVTDHRIKRTIYQLHEVLDGNLDLLIDPLIEADQIERLRQL